MGARIGEPHGDWLATPREQDFWLTHAATRSVTGLEMKQLFRSFHRQVAQGGRLTVKQRELALRVLTDQERVNFEERLVHPVDRMALPIRPPGR